MFWIRSWSVMFDGQASYLERIRRCRGYVDWVFTTPLMLIELGILAGAQQRQTLTLIDAPQ